MMSLNDSRLDDVRDKLEDSAIDEKVRMYKERKQAIAKVNQKHYDTKVEDVETRETLEKEYELNYSEKLLIAVAIAEELEEINV